MGMSSEKRERVSLPWAVAITVFISLPFTFFLGKYNFPLWVCFIVWAEYFALGGKLDTWKLIIPSLPFGAFFGAVWCALAIPLADLIGGQYSMFWGLVVANFIVLPIFVSLIPRWHILEEGTLAVFNGFTLFLAVYFTRSMPSAGMIDNPYWIIFWVFIWTVVMAYFGWFLGWLNVTLTFPRNATNTDQIN